MSESSVDIVNGAADGRPDAASSVPPATPGAILAATRQGHGLTIEQVASHLNLAPRQVMALEADDFAALPGMVIARGFLRSYAKFLRLDPVALLAMLGDQHQPASSTPMRHALSGSFSESRLPSQNSPGGRSRTLPIAAGIALLIAAAAGSYALGWWPETLSRRVGQLRLGALSTDGRGDVSTVSETGSAGGSAESASTNAPAERAGGAESQPAVAPVPVAAPGAGLLTPTTTLSVIVPHTGNEQTARPASTGAGSAAAGAGQMPALTPSSGLSLPRTAPAGGGATTQNPLVLTMQEDSWIELKRADNTPVVSRVIRAGSVETFDVTEPLTLTVGNIAGVEARLRGAPIELASAATGNVARIRLK